VILYNDTGETIPELHVFVCSQSYVFDSIEAEDSIRIRLKPYGAASDIRIERPNPPWRWQGGYIEPKGGYRSVIHLQPDGLVEENTQFSWWQSAVFGKRAATE